MRQALFELLSTMNTQVMSSLQSLKTQSHRPHRSLFTLTKRGHHLDDLIYDFFNHLKRINTKKMVRFYSQDFLKMVQGPIDRPERRNSTLLSFYAELQRAPIEAYDVLIKYKLPFSDLGVDRVLVYTKLKTAETDRYIAIWIERNTSTKSSWKICDLYLHHACSGFSLSVDGPRITNDHFYTLAGELVSDATLTALFFTRHFADSRSTKSEQRIFTDAKRCNRELMKSIQSQTKQLISSLRRRYVSQSLQVVSPKLNKRLEAHREQHQMSDRAPVEEESLTEAYQLLALYQLPARSHRQTRILVHLYLPSLSNYVSVWFTRSLNRDLEWKLDDFYVHKFGKIKPSAFADKDYCMKKFRTIKTRVFYTPDLIGEYLLRLAHARCS